MDTVLSILGWLDLELWLSVGVIFLLLVMSAFFSGSETALTAVSPTKMQAQSDRGNRKAKRVLDVTEDRESLIGAILLGNNLVNILAASLATSLFTRHFGDSGVAYTTLVMTLLVLIFAEVLPKTYAITNSDKAALAVAPVVQVFIWLFSPPVSAIRWLVRRLLGFFGVSADSSNGRHHSRDEITGAIVLGHESGTLQKDDRDRLLGTLDLSSRTVEEIMVHRSEIDMIDVDNDLETIMRACRDSRFSRLPVFQGERENIVGVLHARDMLRLASGMIDGGNPPSSAMEVAREPYFVPDTTTLNDQMREFRKRKTHFALIVDEYGSLIGLITLEDIIEEIIGQIGDEFDEGGEALLKKQADGSYVVDGGMTIRDLNRATDWSLPDGEANTVAGLVIHEAKTLPDIGQAFQFHGFRFEILKREGNRITSLRISPHKR